jgi:hypothetical protein
MADETRLIMNDVSLKEYLESKFRSLEDSTRAAFEAHTQLHLQAEASIVVARLEMDKWKESHNQWQKQMKDEEVKRSSDQQEFIRRPEYTATHNEFSKRIAALEKVAYIAIGFLTLLQLVAYWVKK